MAKKKNHQKTKKVITSTNKTTETIELLHKILICLYAVIIIATINTMLLVVRTAKSTKDDNQVSSYDVSMFQEVTVDTLLEEVDTKDLKVIYIGRDSCPVCERFLPILQKAQKEFKYETLYLDTRTVTTTEAYEKILELDNKDGFLRKHYGKTPMVVITKKKKVVATWLGYDTYKKYSAWLKENGLDKK